MHASRPWSMTLRVADQPFCPVCGHALQSRATIVHNNVAICPTCRGLWNTVLTAAGDALCDAMLARHVTLVAGVLFFTPREEHAFQHNAQTTEPDTEPRVHPAVDILQRGRELASAAQS